MVRLEGEEARAAVRALADTDASHRARARRCKVEMLAAEERNQFIASSREQNSSLEDGKALIAGSFTLLDTVVRGELRPLLNSNAAGIDDP